MWMSDSDFLKDVREEKLEAKQEEIARAYKQFEDILASTEKMRQKAIYVDAELKTKKVETPLKMSETEVKSILKLAEFLLEMAKYYVRKFPEAKKEILREIFSSVPEEAWRTGEIVIDWYKEEKK